jgi:hypothetical protein
LGGSGSFDLVLLSFRRVDVFEFEAVLLLEFEFASDFAEFALALASFLFDT